MSIFAIPGLLPYSELGLPLAAEKEKESNMGNSSVPEETLELYNGKGEEGVYVMHERLQKSIDMPDYIEIEVRYEQVRKLGEHMATFIQAVESLVTILAQMNYRVTVEQPNMDRFTLITAYSPRHPKR